MAILANSGGGKSWAVRRLVESAAKNIQVIIIDPEGEFSTLREKHDFVLCGKDQDVPVEIKSAGKLAEMLLEAKASAIIDLYELPIQDRKKFVRIFFETMIAVPKKLYHPCLVILDEAHDYVPEGKPSEATAAVESMASKGRKREFCLVLASQRISKVSKDALSECNNVMIGRATWAIDRKRAAEELGLTDKTEILSLKKMKPGEFYITGPAVSDDLLRITVGNVFTSHGNKSYSHSKPIPPSESLKKALAKLKDLPQEAEKEAKTINELKTEVSTLKRALSVQKGQNQTVLPQFEQKKVEKLVNEAILKRDNEWKDLLKPTEKQLKEYSDLFKNIKNLLPDLVEGVPLLELSLDTGMSKIKANLINTSLKSLYVGTGNELRDYKISHHKPIISVAVPKKHVIDVDHLSNGELGKGELIILKAIAQHSEGISKEAITVMTGYKRSSRDTYLQRLTAGGYVARDNKGFTSTDIGLEKLGPNFEKLPTGPELIKHHLSNLPEGESRILEFLINVYPREISRDEISDAVGYLRSSRDTYLQRLSSRQLVTFPRSGLVKVVDKLFE